MYVKYRVITHQSANLSYPLIIQFQPLVPLLTNLLTANLITKLPTNLKTLPPNYVYRPLVHLSANLAIEPV